MGQLMNRRVIRRHAGSCVILALALASCVESPPEPEPFDFNTLLNPINGVRVYAGSQFEFAEVDDTTRIQAWGFHDGQGIGTQSVRTAIWTSSDPTMLHIVRSSFSANGASAVLRGGRPGLVTLSVTLNGVTGADTIRVLPRIRELRLKSTRPTLAIGDTVEVWFRADDLNGDSIPSVRPLIVITFGPYALPLQFIGPWPRHRYVGKDTGSVQFYTKVANDSTDLSIRVLPDPL